MIRLGFLLFTMWTLCTAQSTAWAAQVKAVKGKKVLVDMQGDGYSVGDILKIENDSGKTVGLIKVTKTKGDLAEGVFKGKAEKNQVVKLRPAKSKGSTRASTTSSGANKSMYGVMLGFNSASSDVKLPTSGTTVALSGSGFSLKGLMDYTLFTWLNFRGLAGLEQFMVGDATNSECGGECKAEINYLAADFWGRAMLSEGDFRPWVGLGFDLMFPLSKESTALDKASITNTSLIGIGGGFDWKLSATAYIPVQIEYNMYPSSEDVKASSIAMRAGYAFKW